ncbi:MAG: alanine:cation symporter family protein [Moorea sp. SIO3I6]|nr:alanine:cation symporter family protein [Moorena sp. SIO3I6]
MTLDPIFLNFPTLALAANNSVLTNLIAIVNQILNGISNVLFFSISGMPLIVLWLVCGSLFFTFRMNFINIWGFRHAIDIALGKYEQPNQNGEISSFQALSTALSAGVGLGSIGGVAFAISIGGPGAALWMTLAGLLAMSSKFVECTLAQKYRVVRPDGTIAGGPMYYLSAGLAEMGYQKLGKIVSLVFCIFAIAGSFGGSSMFQANQSFEVMASVVPWLINRGWVYGLIMVGLVTLVIIGGIQRIGLVAGTIVPVMCGIYILTSLWILIVNFSSIPSAIETIVTEALSPQAVEGGLIGVLVQGLRRSTFTNEAGIGTSAIAHAAARTEEPVREGIIALLEPFIVTVVICNMTSLVIVITGVYKNSEFAEFGGAEMTAAAFGSVISWFPILLAISVFFFAFSTMISWSYYGEICWDYLFGSRTLIVYKILFLITIFIGAVANPEAVINFSDSMLHAMGLPNLFGAYFLCSKVATELKDYMDRLNSGKIVPVTQSS